MKWTHVFLFVLGLGASTARYLASPFPDGSENPVVGLMALNAPVLLWLMRGLDGFLERDRELFGLPQNKENANGMGSLDQAIEKAWHAC